MARIKYKDLYIKVKNAEELEISCRRCGVGNLFTGGVEASSPDTYA
jgi:hypothetical protein